MAEKRYLMTPGPTPVPPEVLAELARPVIHHREPDYREIYERCLDRLREVYRTEHDVLMFTSSGTGALESAVANLTSPGGRQLVLSAGLFQVGQRCDAELLVNLRDLLRCETWDVQELQHACRHIGPHGLQPGRRPVLMQGADHLSVGDTRYVRVW